MVQLYISQFFTPRLTKYNLRGGGLRVEQPPYNSLVMHTSYLYMIPTYGIYYQLSCHQILEHFSTSSCSPE